MSFSRMPAFNWRYNSFTNTSLVSKYVKMVPSAMPASFAIVDVDALRPYSDSARAVALRIASRFSGLRGHAMFDH